MELYKKHNKHTPFGITKDDISKIAKERNFTGFFEDQPCGKFICVYLLDKKNKYAFIYDSGKNLPKNFKKDLVTHKIHIEAHKKAFEGKETVYEWHASSSDTDLYQSIVLPLDHKEHRNNYVLGLVRVLSSSNPKNSTLLQVAEGTAHSLPQMIIRAREEEKRQITSVLHDEVGSSVLFMNSLLSLLKEDIKEGKKQDALDSINNLEKALNDSADRIKKIIVTLKPPQLADIGLNAAVKELVENMADASDIKFHYTYKVSESFKMSEVIKITLYRVVQEAINNTIKHAKAKKIDIAFKEDKNKIILTIKDDGIGFVQNKHRSIQKLGLLGMKESIAYLGGVLEIKTKKGQGTEIKVECPKFSYVRHV